jgi:hypothetical protein
VSRVRAGSKQRSCCNELLTCARRRVRVVDVEVSVDTLTGLLAQFERTFAARRGFSSDGGS